MNPAEAIDEVRRLISEKGLTVRQIAAGCGVHENSVQRALRGESVPREKTMLGILEAARSATGSRQAYDAVMELRRKGHSTLSIAMIMKMDPRRVRRWCAGTQKPRGM